MNSLEEMILQLGKFRHGEFEPIKFYDDAAMHRFSYSLRDVKDRSLISVKVNVGENNIIETKDNEDDVSLNPGRVAL